MTRVYEAYQARERARNKVLITDAPDTGAQADPRQDSWTAAGCRLSDFRPERPAFATPPRASVADAAARRADVPPTSSRVCLRCPACAHEIDSGRWPAWILKLLHTVHISPYRCGVCGFRFSRLESEAGPSDPPQGDRAVFQAFLAPDDQRSLGEVIRAIARDERGSDVDSGAPRM